ncbi:DUF5067 domain-containing protein [Streptococcaceae bacterium ESL0687]|nr:DUF5067 domain-containing protein [Streptococcaceae bacterium ESL0687]
MKKKNYMALALLSLLVLGGCSSTSKSTESSTSASSSVSSETSKTSESSTKDKASDGYTYDEATKTFTNKSGSIQILNVSKAIDIINDPAVKIDVTLENKTDRTLPIYELGSLLLVFEQKNGAGPNTLDSTSLPGDGMVEGDGVDEYIDPLSVDIAPGEKVSVHYVFYTESSEPIIADFLNNSYKIVKAVEFPIQ